MDWWTHTIMTEKDSLNRAIKILKNSKPKISVRDKALCLLEGRLKALNTYCIYKYGNKTTFFSTDDLKKAVSVATVTANEENRRMIIKRKGSVVWDSRENMTIDLFC